MAEVRGGGFTKCRATEPFRGSCRADMAQMALVALRRNNRAGQLGRCCISRMGEEVHERQANAHAQRVRSVTFAKYFADETPRAYSYRKNPAGLLQRARISCRSCSSFYAAS